MGSFLEGLSSPYLVAKWLTCADFASFSSWAGPTRPGLPQLYSPYSQQPWCLHGYERSLSLQTWASKCLRQTAKITIAASFQKSTEVLTWRWVAWVAALWKLCTIWENSVYLASNSCYKAHRSLAKFEREERHWTNRSNCWNIRNKGIYACSPRRFQ